MLTPDSNTVQFGTAFSTTIVVSTSDTSVDPDTGLPVTIETPITDVPVVTPDFVDPGVTVSAAPGLVTISGTYTSIISIPWHWLDLNFQPQSGTTPPAAGTYSKMIRVDSPAVMTSVCNYTIVGGSTTDVFAQTVDLVSYNNVSGPLKALVAGTPP